jgi:excisionase family DNA binding protein
VFDRDRFYSPTEVWKETRAARAQVYQALDDGQLRGIRRGRRWLIPGSAASEWVDAQARERPADIAEEAS